MILNNEQGCNIGDLYSIERDTITAKLEKCDMHKSLPTAHNDITKI